MTAEAALAGTRDGYEMETWLCLSHTGVLRGRLRKKMILSIFKENYFQPESLFPECWLIAFLKTVAEINGGNGDIFQKLRPSSWWRQIVTEKLDWERMEKTVVKNMVDGDQPMTALQQGWGAWNQMGRPGAGGEECAGFLIVSYIIGQRTWHGEGSRAVYSPDDTHEEDDIPRWPIGNTKVYSWYLLLNKFQQCSLIQISICRNPCKLKASLNLRCAEYTSPTEYLLSCAPPLYSEHFLQPTFMIEYWVAPVVIEFCTNGGEWNGCAETCDHKVESWKMCGSKSGVLIGGKTHRKLVPWGGEEQCGWRKLCTLAYSSHTCPFRLFLLKAIRAKKNRQNAFLKMEE